jgi:imidazole glycerol-phosphate synthase subunit HisF
VEQSIVYDREGADELVFLDITASHEGRGLTLEMARRVAETVFIPFTVGGGIRSVEDMRAIIATGADKVSINTAAVLDPGLISRGAKAFGSNAVVVAIDARRRIDTDAVAWETTTHGGRRRTGLDAIEWAIECERLGAGEILLTSMDADGTKGGYDVALTRAVADAVSVPVIASGGAGSLDHFRSVLTDGAADAALAASLFHFRELSISDLKQYLLDHGVWVRQ